MNIKKLSFLSVLFLFLTSSYARAAFYHGIKSGITFGATYGKFGFDNAQSGYGTTFGVTVTYLRNENFQISSSLRFTGVRFDNVNLYTQDNQNYNFNAKKVKFKSVNTEYLLIGQYNLIKDRFGIRTGISLGAIMTSAQGNETDTRLYLDTSGTGYQPIDFASPRFLPSFIIGMGYNLGNINVFIQNQFGIRNTYKEISGKYRIFTIGATFYLGYSDKRQRF